MQKYLRNMYRCTESFVKTDLFSTSGLQNIQFHMYCIYKRVVFLLGEFVQIVLTHERVDQLHLKLTRYCIILKGLFKYHFILFQLFIVKTIIKLLIKSILFTIPKIFSTLPYVFIRPCYAKNGCNGQLLINGIEFQTAEKFDAEICQT